MVDVSGIALPTTDKVGEAEVVTTAVQLLQLVSILNVIAHGQSTEEYQLEHIDSGSVESKRDISDIEIDHHISGPMPRHPQLEGNIFHKGREDLKKMSFDE
jgi:hypothetical protein